jgi:transcriptional regulator with XRE-family HTH domain
MSIRGHSRYPMTDPREVVRCPFCSLVQYRTKNGMCRKCSELFDPPPPIVFDPAIGEQTAPESPVSIRVCERIRYFRRARHLNQRELARRMGAPRTYMTKVEHFHCVPTLALLERFADALGVEMWQLFATEREEQEAVISADPFLVELAAVSAKLDSKTRAFVVGEAQRISTVNQGYR